MVPLARKTLIHEWRRFLPAVVALGFAGVLLLLQAALVLGIFSSTSIYVTGSAAQLWAGRPGTQSVSLGQSIEPEVGLQMRADPAVRQVEPFYWVDASWQAGPQLRTENAYLIGLSTAADAMAFAHIIDLDARRLLARPDAVIVDQADLGKLDTQVGGQAWINGHRVRVVAAVRGLRALGGVNVLASLETAQHLEADPQDVGRPTFFLIGLQVGSDAGAVARRLGNQRGLGRYVVWTAEELAQQSLRYWLLETGAGVGTLFMAVMVFLVGAIITSQTLMGAMAASRREYATLHALGISMRQLRRIVLQQALWVAGVGLAGAALLTALILPLARRHDVPLELNAALVLACLGAVALLAGISGLAATRSLRGADPASLLR